ncbi:MULTISPECIES: YfcC family protein [Microvirgula]|nr:MULTISPECIES: YfcC family protein [Microvirgula]RAS19040.1 putative ion transporter superfamily protein YfcC [Microvirgula sp. AG722]
MSTHPATNAPMPPDSRPARKSFRMPDIYIVLSVFILVMAVLTFIIPAGEYTRETLQTAHGPQTLVVAGTYHQVAQQPVGFMQLVTAIPDGLKRAASIVFLTFMVGGGMGLIKRAGLIDIGVHKLIDGVGDKGFLVIPILIGIFTGLAAFIGVPELSLAYLPVLLPLFYRLGYDGMSAMAVALLGPCMGFTFGLTIPGSVGVGQQIAQLPIFSGSAFRAVVLVIVTIVTVAYVMRYAARVKADPSRSLTLDSDQLMRAELQEAQREQGELVVTRRHILAGLACLVMFPCAIAAILINNLGFEAIGGLFLFIGITASAIAGKRPQQICDDVNAGMRDMMVAALLCGVASAIAVVMDRGVITDTLVYWLEQIMRSVPAEVSAIVVFWEQALFNALVPGATALTVLTMPVLSPLGTLLGISQQAVVTANAWGGQLTDIFFPTSGFFVATLVMGKVDFGKWIRFYTPLMLILGAIACVALYLMQTMNLGM